MKKIFRKNIYKLHWFKVKKSYCLWFFIFCWPLFSFAIPFKGTQFVLSGPSPDSPKIAKNLFKKGGNIIDMGVGVAFALSVTHPYYVSLGSGGFALIKMNSSIKALDFREVAPYQMSPDYFEKSGLSSTKGEASVAIPGFVAGLFELHKKYGKLSWAEVIQPAISLAEKGFPVSGEWVSISDRSKNKFNKKGKEIFFKKKASYKPNEIFKQPQLAEALRLLQKEKRKAFYGGKISEDILSSIKKRNILITKDDFKKYKVRWLKPISFFFKKYKIHSMPLPSSGGIILARALKLIEKQKLHKNPLYSFNELHLLAEIMSRAFIDRVLMGDPDFLKEKTFNWLSDQKIDELHKTISLKKTNPIFPSKESEETTHLSILDAKGNALSMTLTLNGLYGSHIVTKKYGIVLNNQMDDFTTLQNQPNMFGLIQGKNNLVQGGKRPLSSMTPTIVEKNKKTILVLGAGGGPMIINSVLQTLYRHLVNGLDIEQAVFAPRIHHQFLPQKLFIENKKFNPELIKKLKTKGHQIQFRNYIAQVFAVSRNEKNILMGATESRKESAAGGL